MSELRIELRNVLITQRSSVQMRPPQPIVGGRPPAQPEAVDFCPPGDLQGPLGRLCHWRHAEVVYVFLKLSPGPLRVTRY